MNAPGFAQLFILILILIGFAAMQRSSDPWSRWREVYAARNFLLLFAAFFLAVVFMTCLAMSWNIFLTVR